MAIQSATMLAAERGVDLLQTYSRTYLPVLIEKIVRARKTGQFSA